MAASPTFQIGQPTMSTQTANGTDRLFLTTDDMQNGFVVVCLAVPVASMESNSNPSEGQIDGSWALLLQGELEEAVDSALLRSTLAQTPTLSGRGHALF